MKAKPGSIIAVLLLMPYPLAADYVAEVRCKELIESQCYLEWDMSSTVGTQYRLERFDVEKRGWRLHVRLPAKSSGITDEALPVGALYRVCVVKRSPISNPALHRQWYGFHFSLRTWNNYRIRYLCSQAAFT